MSEKTEKATPYKLQKAKEKGQVSKSIELTTSLAMLSLLLVMMALWSGVLTQLMDLLRLLLNLAGRISLTKNSVIHLHQFFMTQLLDLWLPLGLTAILAVILLTMAQTGFVWSTYSLIPNFKRLDLSQGLKRLFSSKLLFEMFKNGLKFLLVLGFISLGFKQSLPRFIQLIHTSPAQYPALLMPLFFKLLMELILTLLCIAFLDKLYTRWRFGKDQRMSKQELKDEYKQREGSPLIKSKIKSLQKQLRLKTASLKQVKSADVVITNPTHLAIALQYRRQSMPAPKILCKARGTLARQVKFLAKRHGIPIIENKPFAQVLYATVNLNQYIKREHYPLAAMIFREIYQQQGQAL